MEHENTELPVAEWLAAMVKYDGEKCEHGKHFFEDCPLCDERNIADLYKLAA